NPERGRKRQRPPYSSIPARTRRRAPHHGRRRGLIVFAAGDEWNGAPVPFIASRENDEAPSTPVVGRSPAGPGWYGTVWRPLSLAPPLGIASAPQLFAAFGLFVIVALYPVT